MTDSKPAKSHLAPAQAFALEGLVDYAEGAVVSRVLAKTSAGTVTLFAFDADQALSEHTAPFDALVQVIAGEAEIVVGGTPNRVHAGEVLLMPANVAHSLRAVSPFKMLLTMLREASPA